MGGVGECVEPLGVFGLQGEQFVYRVAPSLWSRAAIGRPAIADDGGGRVAAAVAGLALGAGEGLLAEGFAPWFAGPGRCREGFVGHQRLLCNSSRNASNSSRNAMWWM